MRREVPNRLSATWFVALSRKTMCCPATHEDVGKGVMMVTAAFLPGLTGGPLLRPMPSHTTVALSMRTPLENTPAGRGLGCARRQLNSASRGTTPNEASTGPSSKGRLS